MNFYVMHLLTSGLIQYNCKTSYDKKCCLERETMSAFNYVLARGRDGYLLLFDRFENFDNALLVARDIYTFKYLTIFSPSHFPNNFIVILFTEHAKRKWVIIGKSSPRNHFPTSIKH